MIREKNNSRSRRSFIKKIAAGGAGLAVTSGIPAASYARIIGANDRVRVGIVGFSDRTRSSLVGAMHRFSDELNFEFVALSDIYQPRVEEGITFVEESTGARIEGFRNNEEMYDSGTVDAVIIGTADHQHAIHTIEAIDAGCHAYVEKPLANTMEDAKDVLAAVEGSNLVVQNGTQRRSAQNYQMANEYLRSGDFGEIVFAEMTWNVNQPGRWRRPALVEKTTEQDVDWNRFLVNRPFEPFDPRKYWEYRLFWPYSSGIPCQWMVHQIDTVHWFTDLPRPRSVTADGGVYQWKDGRANYDTLTIVFEYGPLDGSEEGFQVVYSSRFSNSAGGVKELYYSNGGMLDLDQNKVTPTGGLEENHAAAMNMEPNLLSEMNLADDGGIDVAADTGVDDATAANMKNWMECIRNGGTPNADIRAGYNHSVALCMTIEAMHTGQQVTFDDDAQAVVAVT